MHLCQWNIYTISLVTWKSLVAGMLCSNHKRGWERNVATSHNLAPPHQKHHQSIKHPILYLSNRLWNFTWRIDIPKVWRFGGEADERKKCEGASKAESCSTIWFRGLSEEIMNRAQYLDAALQLSWPTWHGDSKSLAYIKIIRTLSAASICWCWLDHLFGRYVWVWRNTHESAGQDVIVTTWETSIVCCKWKLACGVQVQAHNTNFLQHCDFILSCWGSLKLLPPSENAYIFHIHF